MVEGESVTSERAQETTAAAPVRMTRTYAYIWDNFAAWCEASGRASLPAATEDVADYIRERADAGARPSTLRVIAAAIARRHALAGLDNPCESEAVQLVLEEFTQGATPGSRRVLPLDMDCYRAIRETAHEPRRSRGGLMETPEAAQRRGALDVAIIGLMRDAQLKVREAAKLTWDDLEPLGDGTGRVYLPGPPDAREARTVSSSTMRALNAVDRSGGDGRILNLSPNRIGLRVRDAALQAGLGEGYAGESPRMGMMADLETLAVELLGAFVDSEPRQS